MEFTTHTDLRAQPAAALHVKNEIVEVTFALESGALQSREGPNRYAVGDALITGSTGDRWSVSRDRFDAKYAPITPTRSGADGRYANKPLPVLAMQVLEDFSIERSSGGDRLHGKSGDWLMQYAPGDHGIVEQSKFAKVYRRLNQSV